MSAKAGASFLRRPDPAARTKGLLEALMVNLPAAMLKSTITADTKKKCPLA